MIKFFRKIRQGLIKENRTGKYLLYAVGEIILVVIGILIALSINNWNENRKIQIKTQSYLSEILNDLKADTLAFSRGINYYKELLASKETELLKTDLRNTQIEKLERLITPSHYADRITDNTFQKIKNSGLTKLSEQKLLSGEINSYYTNIQDFHNVMIYWEIESTYKEADYWYYEQDIYETRSPDKFPVLQNIEENRINLIQLLESPIGRNHLRVEYERKQRMIEHLEFMYEEASDLIKEIQKELGTI